MLRDCLLVCNAGSATLKVKIFKLADLSVLVDGIAERIGLPGSTVEIAEIISGRMIRRNFPAGLQHHRQATDELFGHLAHWRERIRCAAHRIVHGGEQYTKPTWLKPEVRDALRRISNLAPLHNPINLETLAEVEKLLPRTPNLGVFDTAYFATLPPETYLYALPHEYYEKYGIRRYGFHGISHQYLAQTAAEKLKKPITRLRLITCHLGSGCSLTATKFGQAVETTMGFTPLEGLTMGTRSGDVDPAAVTFLQRTLNISAGEVDDILNRQSGILGLFGYSSDLRDVLVAAGYEVPGYQPPKPFTAEDRTRAKVALGVFIYDIVRYIGSLSMVMGGVHAIVFSGAIGVRSPVVRSLVKQRLTMLKGVKFLVIPTDEELMIARLTQKMALRYRRVVNSPVQASDSSSSVAATSSIGVRSTEQGARV